MNQIVLFALSGMFLLIFIPSNSLKAQRIFNPLKMTPGLLSEIYEREDDSRRVVIMLGQQADEAEMRRHIAETTLRGGQRSQYVIGELQNVAANTQPELVDRLSRLSGVDLSNLESYWVVNAVMVDATVEAIFYISLWDEVKIIELDDQPDLIMPVAAEASSSVPNGREPGHNVINAPGLWALGYTGYGTKALIIDSGNDPDHYALMTNFWWHNAPIEQAWTGFGGFAEDCGSHGSHVNGTVNGLNRLTNDTIGVAFNAHWQGAPMGFAVGNGCSRPFNQNIRTTMQSFQWAMDPDGNPATSHDMPDVINCSWTSGQYGCANNTSITLLNNVMAAGIAVVWANGNAGPEPATVCCAQGINTTLVNSFTVGAVNNLSTIANFSSRGPSPCSQAGGSLAIKPEVSAPGVSVRSSVPGNLYANFSGTSMAAPHVSGAVLLLKEAFPFLDGETLLFALYYSAVDKGEPGEDNAYGMGVIDVLAAYHWLLDEGHEPVPPVNADNDIVLVGVMIPEKPYCSDAINSDIIVQNAGIDTVVNFLVQYSILATNPISGSFTWEGSLPPGELTVFNLPESLELPGGFYEMLTEISMPNGQVDPRDLNNRFKRQFQVIPYPVIQAALPAVFAGATCIGSAAVVEINMDIPNFEMVEWYDSPSGGNLLGTGPVLITEPLWESTTVYADIRTYHQAGKPQNLPGVQSMENDNGAGLLFNALQPFRLRSVKVYADVPGTRLIQLYDGDNNPMGLRAVNIPEPGEHRVELNYDIPAGENYKLVKFAGLPLGINLNGNFFPYSTDLVSIRRSYGIDNTALQSLRYYYFYDWVLETTYACGRAAVDIEVTSGETFPVGINASASEVLLEDGSAQIIFSAVAEEGELFYWNFGNGNTAEGEQVTADFSNPGSFVVTLTVLNGAGCANSASVQIQVQGDAVNTEEPDLVNIQELEVFPNPGEGLFYLQFADRLIRVVDIRVFDLAGRVITSKSAEVVISEPLMLDLRAYPAGFYTVQVTDGNGARYTAALIRH